MARQELPDRVAAPLLMSVGAAIVLLHLGVIPYTSGSGGSAMFDGAHPWQILCIGLSFFCAGAAFALKKRRLLQAINWLVFVASFFGVAGWMLFYSGHVSLPFQVVGGIVLAVAGLGAVMGLRDWQRNASAAAKAPPDPIAEAEVYLAYGRRAQAEAILQQAIKSDPVRAAEFRARLEVIQNK